MKKGGDNKRPSKETSEKRSASLTGRVVSIETRKKLSEARRLYFQENPEGRKLISERRRGRPISDAQKLKISETLTGRRGFKHSQESKEKMSKSRSGRPVSDETRKKLKEAWARRKMKGGKFQNK